MLNLNITSKSGLGIEFKSRWRLLIYDLYLCINYRVEACFEVFTEFWEVSRIIPSVRRFCVQEWIQDLTLGIQQSHLEFCRVGPSADSSISVCISCSISYDW